MLLPNYCNRNVSKTHNIVYKTKMQLSFNYSVNEFLRASIRRKIRRVLQAPVGLLQPKSYNSLGVLGGGRAAALLGV